MGGPRVPPARTPQQLRQWRGQIAAAFAQALGATPTQELRVRYVQTPPFGQEATLVKADGARDDYTVRLADGSLMACTSSRIVELLPPRAAALGVQGPPATGGAGAGAGGGAAAPAPLQRTGSAQAKVQQLVAMGFSEVQADDALEGVGGQLDAAIEACLRAATSAQNAHLDALATTQAAVIRIIWPLFLPRFLTNQAHSGRF